MSVAHKRSNMNDARAHTPISVRRSCLLFQNQFTLMLDPMLMGRRRKPSIFTMVESNVCRFFVTVLSRRSTNSENGKAIENSVRWQSTGYKHSANRSPHPEAAFQPHINWESSTDSRIPCSTSGRLIVCVYFQTGPHGFVYGEIILCGTIYWLDRDSHWRAKRNNSKRIKKKIYSPTRNVLLGSQHFFLKCHL